MPRAKYTDPDAVRLGAIIQRLRLARGWTLAKCAQRTGMNATYLSIVEKGGNMPSVQMLFEIADVFNVRPSELIREVEDARTTASWNNRPAE